MSMDPMAADTPAAEKAPAKGEPEALDLESESKAAMAVLTLSSALPPCDGFTIEPADGGSLVVTCSGGEGDGRRYAVSAAALEAAAAELAPELQTED